MNVCHLCTAHVPAVRSHGSCTDYFLLLRGALLTLSPLATPSLTLVDGTDQSRVKRPKPPKECREPAQIAPGLYFDDIPLLRFGFTSALSILFFRMRAKITHVSECELICETVNAAAVTCINLPS